MNEPQIMFPLQLSDAYDTMVNAQKGCEQWWACILITMMNKWSMKIKSQSLQRIKGILKVAMYQNSLRNSRKQVTYYMNQLIVSYVQQMNNGSFKRNDSKKRIIRCQKCTPLLEK